MSEHTDPVCGIKVDANTPYKSRREERTIYFCSEPCKRKFDENPQQYEARG